MQFVNINGTFINSEEAVFSVDNRAFRYGDGIFDTIRVINGVPCFMDAHFNRIEFGMNSLKMKYPQGFTLSYLNDQIESLLRKNGISEGARVRVSIYRNSGGYYTPESNEISYCIESTPLESNFYDINERGLKIDIYDEYKKSVNKFSALKTINGLPFVLAGLHKNEMKLDDCILLNELGNISETINSNIFIGYNGVFYTPSLNQGCVEGVMRNIIIDIARSKNIEVQECPMGPSALLRADEVFVTNAINGIRWVSSYKQKRYFRKISEMLVETLNKRVVDREEALSI